VGEATLRAAHALQPDIIVASGDFTQRAKREQFQQARDFLNLLPEAPLVVTPGNHDVPLYRVAERVRNPYAGYLEFISDELDSSLFHHGAAVVSINSTSPLRAITNGRITAEQLEFCSETFKQAPEEAVRIVVAHHHFAPAPDYEGGSVMPKAKRAIERFIDLKVDLILGGHLHRAYIGNSLDIYPGKDRRHGIIIVQCGTTTSRRGRAREREKNSFNLIQIDAATVRIVHYMYFDDIDGFEPVSEHLFPRAMSPFLRTFSVRTSV
jgi:3',5'-cyclic AMP phosphodiesterase CpdA